MLLSATQTVTIRNFLDSSFVYLKEWRGRGMPE